MKVKDLQAQLAACNSEDTVYLYLSEEEGGERAGKVISAEAAKKLYFKGDAPWNEDATNFVVIK